MDSEIEQFGYNNFGKTIIISTIIFFFYSYILLTIDILKKATGSILHKVGIENFVK